MVALPVLAVGAVWVATIRLNDTNLEDSLKFRVVPLSRGVGTSGISSPDQLPPVTFATGTRPIVYETESGESVLIQAEPGFVDAFADDQANATSALNQRLLITAGAAAAAAAVVGILSWRRIVRPVETLTGAARAMAAGDLAQRVHVDSTDELGQLGDAFNAMAESVERDARLRRTMTSDVAHELRTPLNNLSGYLDAIAEGVVEPDREVIGSLQEEAATLTRLVADLEQLALAEAGFLQLYFGPTDIAAIAERAAAAIQPRARTKGVAVAFETPPPGLPHVMGDEARLGQVVRNLLENAVRHTPPGGSVRVRASAGAGRVEVAVTDTGPGIPEEHLPFIFERFYRVDAARAHATGGAGLGLAIVRQLVEAHGGTIEAHNVRGGGAEFVVSLTRLAGEASPASPAALSPVQQPS
jgi:two-component system sensor histidine kinase BaeS